MYVTYYINFMGVNLGLICLYLDLHSKVKSLSYPDKDFNTSQIIGFLKSICLMQQIRSSS